MNDVSYDGFKNSTSMEFFPYKEEAQLQRMAGDKEYMEYHKLSKKYSDYLSDKGDELGAQEEARFAELYEKIKDRLGFAEDDYKKGYELYLKENAEYQKPKDVKPDTLLETLDCWDSLSKLSVL